MNLYCENDKVTGFPRPLLFKKSDSVTMDSRFPKMFQQMMVGISTDSCPNTWNELEHFNDIDVIAIFLLKFLPVYFRPFP